MPFFMVGAAEICRCLGISRRALFNWRKNHGFPCGILPDGRMATTADLVNQWVMARLDLVAAATRNGRLGGLNKGKKQALTGESSSDGPIEPTETA